MEQITMKPGTFVVFEGLDATGKTTQLSRIADAANGRFGGQLFDHPIPLFTHQPSGMDPLGAEIYKITEEMDINSTWCRQFLHLASHANHYQNHILPALAGGRSVFMDRCWWSTVAYGYFGGEILEMSVLEFMRIAQLPAQGHMPDVVFAFEEPWKDDHHNTDAVRAGYNWLITHHFMEPVASHVVPVPAMSIEDCTAFIFKSLTDLDLTA